MAYNLTPFEHAVIALSRNDPVSSLKQHSAFVRWIMGYDERRFALADEKLEALRRYAILRRVSCARGVSLASQERVRLFNAGYRYDEIVAIDELVLRQSTNTAH